MQLDSGIVVRNVVSTADIGRRLDLNEVMARVENVEKKHNFTGLVYRLDGKVVLIFSSGKLVSVGCRSWEESVEVLEKTVETLKQAGLVADVEVKITVQNYVASFSLFVDVDLERAANAFEKTIYEPFIFPGLMLWLDRPRVAVLLFSNGNGVCAGAKSREEIIAAVDFVRKTLQQKGLLGLSSVSPAQ